MPGKSITKEQKELYMNLRAEGESQELAAAKVSISKRSAKRIEKSKNRNVDNQKRGPKNDPLEQVWESQLVPLLEREPKLQSITLLEFLQGKFPGQYDESVLRTLQRRVKIWKAIHGPEKEIIFRQFHPPGLQGMSDFTNCNELKVTIRSVSFPHLIYRFCLPFSNWEYTQVCQGGESFPALSEGIQNALHELQGCPLTHRTDSLSAAYKNRGQITEEDFTKSYEELCANYGMKPTRNNKGVKHENGSVEVLHWHGKTKLKQDLMIRGSKDFDSFEDYCEFVSKSTAKKNSKRSKAFLEEKKHLKPLPNHKSRDFDLETVRVNGSSIILVRQVRYTVQSRLIGNLLKIHIFDGRLECFLGTTHVRTLVRLRWNKGPRPRYINYKDVIPSLVRKPQAFRNYVYRDDLFPTYAFEETWKLLDASLDERTACKEMVKILNITAESKTEQEISKYLEKLLLQKVTPRLKDIERQFGNVPEQLIEIQVQTRDLDIYDVLLQNEEAVGMA